MTENEYQELIAYIGEKFEQVDRRFDQMATKVELQETRRHMGVLVEAVRDDVRQLAEGLAGTNQRLDGMRDQLAGMDQRLGGIDQRLGGVERRLDGVDQRLVDVEGRLGNVEQGLDRLGKKVEAESTETRAMIRVSYAQLDERIQSLEHNYAALNDRVARLEANQA